MKSYKGITFEGSTFPDSPYKDVVVKLNSTITGEYIPSLEKALPNITKGLRSLMISMTHQEGFKPGTRAYRFKNPGNVNNTDSGHNTGYETLEAGIKAQADFLTAIANGEKKAFPLNKEMVIKPFFSSEIHDNPSYGLGDGNVPGYKFTYTGQLDQFIKIYATGSRLSNNYLNIITSYFKANGLIITPESTLHDIIAMN